MARPPPPPPPPEVKPLPGESEFQARTRAIHENMGESADKQFAVAWHLSMVQSQELYLKAGYPSLATYIEAEIPELGVTWAYALLNVINAFEYWDIVKYGVTALNEVIKLCHTAVEFRDKYMPVNLISRPIEFADVDGRPIRFDFENQHGVAHLKALVAIARAAAIGKKETKPKKVSDATRALEAAAKQAAESVEGSAWSVRERHHKTTLVLEVESAHIDEVVQKLAALLAAAK